MTTRDRQPAAWRERKKDLLRAQIIRTAVRLFIERGFDDVSLEEITDAAGCSRSTFHRYFGTKEELLFPGVDTWLSELENELRQIPSDSDAWTVARATTTRALRGFTLSLDPELRNDYARLWLTGPTPQRRYLEIVRAWERVLQQHFARALGPGSEEALECHLLAYLVSSALRAALNVALVHTEEMDEATERAFELIEASPLVHDLRARRRNAGEPLRPPSGTKETEWSIQLAPKLASQS